MSFSVAYRDTGSVVGHYHTRSDAVRDAVAIAFDRPDLSFIVGVIEIGEDGLPVRPFASASDLLAANDHDAVTAAESWTDSQTEVAAPVEDIALTIENPNGEPGKGGISKGEFVDRVAADSGLSRSDAGAAVESVIKSIEAALGAGEEVNFTGFGTFHVAEGSTREGRNPRTGETMSVSSSDAPRFTIARDVPPSRRRSKP